MLNLCTNQFSIHLFYQTEFYACMVYLISFSIKVLFEFSPSQEFVLLRNRLLAFLSVGLMPIPFNVAFYSNTFRLSIRNIRLLYLSALQITVSSRTKCFKHPSSLPKHQFWHLKPLRRVVFDIQFLLIFRFSEIIA
jgi:hypothetical protein